MTLEEAKEKIEELDSDGMFNSSDYEGGFSDAKEKMLKILDDTEPVGNSDKLTLKESANELRKIFKFRYLTAEAQLGKIVALWTDKPLFTGYEWHFTNEAKCVLDIRFHHIPILDLSEYKNADGNIDYSKCIVEVEE